MHGLIFRTLQVFIEDTYGDEKWRLIAERAALEHPDFEAMLYYDGDLLVGLLQACADVLDKLRESILEDVGIYLVSHPNCEALRRLLRFGGFDFIEFLHSLDELPERTRLAVADLDLPDLELRDEGNNQFTLQVTGAPDGFSDVLVGMLRAMADDYGALVLLDHSERRRHSDTITISVIETEYAAGREFALGGAPA